MPIKAITFDFDGTLADTNHLKRAAYFQLFPDFVGREETIAAAIDAGWDATRLEIITQIVRSLYVDETIDAQDSLIQEKVAQYGKIVLAGAIAAPEIRGASAALTELSVNHALYLNSLTPTIPLTRITEERGWARHFRKIYGSPERKSDNLRRILDHAGLNPYENVVVGDSETDLLSSQEVGCPFIAIRFEYRTNSFRSLPDMEKLPTAIMELKKVTSTANELR